MSIWDPEYRKQKAEAKATLISSGSAMYNVSIAGFVGLTALFTGFAVAEGYAAYQLRHKEAPTVQDAQQSEAHSGAANTHGQVALVMVLGTGLAIRAKRKDREIIERQFP